MDIITIEEAIKELEQSPTTVSNVKELAGLYIVRDHIQNTLDDGLDGLNDDLNTSVLPNYINYVDLKSKFQRNEITEEPVIQSIKCVCSELFDLVQTLYSSTDMKKERDAIRALIKNLNDCNY